MKKIIILTLIISPLLTSGQANKIYRKALRATDLKERVELFSEVIKLEPKNFDAYFYRAIAKNDLGDYNGAIIDYSKVIVFEPDADTYYNRGNSKYSLQDFEGAKEDYENAYKLDPNFIDALYSLGCTKYDLGDLDGAIKDFNIVLNKDPYIIDAYKLRASIHRVNKRYKKALEEYSYVILVTGNSDAYYNRGEFYLSINYHKKANIDFSNAIKQNKNNSYAYFYRGVTNFFSRKYVDAISDFSKALEFDATDFDAMLGLALSYYRINDFDNAKLNFKKAKNILSTNKAIDESLKFFENTYWYQNQKPMFSMGYDALNKL